MRKQILNTGKRMGLCMVAMFLAAGGVFGQQDSRPKPPRSLKYLFEHFRELEEAHREGEWEEAAEALEALESGMGRIAGAVGNAGAESQLNGFNRLVTEYQGQLRERTEAEAAEEQFLTMQLSFFTITDFFAYRVPPAVDFFDQQLEEFKEEVLEEGAWDQAETELEEIEEFWELIEERYLEELQDKQQNHISGISQGIEDLARWTKTRDVRRSTDTIREIRSRLRELREGF